MTKFSTYFCVSVVGLMALGFSASAVQAQDDTENQLTAEGLSLGEKVDETRKPGDTYFNGEFDDWSLRCIVVPDKDDPCQMYQLLADEGGSPMVEFTMFRLTEGSQAAAGATIVVPLETALTEGLTIKVDEEPARSYPFLFCNTVGCYARIGLTQEEVDMYRSGAEAKVSLVPIGAPDQRVVASLSLNGFTAAFEAASVINQ